MSEFSSNDFSYHNFTNDTTTNHNWVLEDGTDGFMILPMFLFFILFIATLITVTGNSLVIGAFINDVRIREKPSNLYILNLSVSDLIVGVFVMPIYLIDKVLPIHTLFPQWYEFCVWWQLLTLFGLLCSFHSIIIITYDRYKLVRDPFSYVTHQTYQTAFKFLTCSWVFSLLVIIGYFLFLLLQPNEAHKHEAHNACGVLHPKFFEHFILRYGTVIEPVVLSSTLIGLNIAIVVHLYRRSKELAAYNTDEATSNPVETSLQQQEMGDRSSKSENKAELVSRKEDTFANKDEGFLESTKHIGPRKLKFGKNDCIKHLKKSRKAIHKLFILVSVYKICFFPWFIVTILEAFSFEVNFTIIEIANIFMWLNSMVNPFLYASTNIRLRRGMRNLLRG